jgi:predicted ArsR family transcriptional regulator
MRETSDSGLIELLRVGGSQTVADLAAATQVTQTAVRQRLTRLMAQGLVCREAVKAERGRPSHRYQLTEKARRQAGSNFADLAVVLWQEIRSVREPEIRRNLLKRITDAMAARYRQRILGTTLLERMRSLKDLFAERGVPFAVEQAETLPILTARDCPYPELAEQDRGICAMEKMLFSELLDQPVRLSQCRLDGHNCCQFQTS